MTKSPLFDTDYGFGGRMKSLNVSLTRGCLNQATNDFDKEQAMALISPMSANSPATGSHRCPCPAVLEEVNICLFFLV